MVLCSLNFPVPIVSEFTSDIITLDIESPLIIGNELIIHTKSDNSIGIITKIHQIRIGEKIKKSLYFNI